MQVSPFADGLGFNYAKRENGEISLNRLIMGGNSLSTKSISAWVV
jgi:hypothetical protein